MTCPVCKNDINKRAIKNHLKNRHGWRYTVESPDMPVDVSGVKT